MITIYISMILLLFNCGQKNQETMTSPSPVDKLIKYKQYYTSDPYQLLLNIESKEDQFKLVVDIELDEGSYFASPYSKDKMQGYFDIVLNENDHLVMDKGFLEIPKSIESIDPFANEPVHWVSQNTSYSRKLEIKNEKDFVATGYVRFVIEPKCTLEKINFEISQVAGNLKINKINTYKVADK